MKRPADIALTTAETLERFELPWFGRVASNFVDAEQLLNEALPNVYFHLTYQQNFARFGGNTKSQQVCCRLD